ncbi:unnamed protein product [Didymodactylos carnosus]|uniref:Uncharacterized protein n=1 Tax=Didymodactylos carnosus TaxID=1234261 RepID=A0A814A192_9BILA|nr:unnamed protein product [Didymodactylos carnosus]CAF3687705.1 unnamed protein product [Didymodactylos carnosus]
MFAPSPIRSPLKSKQLQQSQLTKYFASVNDKELSSSLTFCDETSEQTTDNTTTLDNSITTTTTTTDEEQSYTDNNTSDNMITDENCSPDQTSTLNDTLTTPKGNKIKKRLDVDEEDSAYKQRLRKMPRKMYNDDGGLKQTIIDAGQKSIDCIVCRKCGMSYFPHSVEDRALHDKFHDLQTSALKFKTILKREQICQQFLDGNIYVIGCTSSVHERNKAENIRKFIDTELGITTPFNCVWPETKAYFYVEDRTDLVIGYCLAQIIHRAHIVDADCDHLNTQNEIQKMFCGIARIWVHKDHRRSRVATKLLNCARINFFFGITMKRTDIAFSSPTDDGKILAKNYTKSNRLFIY